MYYEMINGRGQAMDAPLHGRTLVSAMFQQRSHRQNRGKVGDGQIGYMYISYDIRSWVSVWNCFSFLFPHIFVWGSCFWFCIPPPSPPPPPAASSSNLSTHNLLTQNCPHTTCPHTTCSHTTCPHTTCSHTTCHIQLVHTQLVHTQLWHLVTSTVTLRGRRGTYGTGPALVVHRVLSWRRGRRGSLRGRRGTWRQPPSLCVAGVALTALGGLWWRTGFSADAVDAAALCVAGVALGDSHLHFAWQAWHLVTSTVTLRGRRGTYGTGPALVAHRVLSWRRGRRGFLRGKRGTWPQPPSLGVAGVALGDIDRHFAWQAWLLRHWAGSGGAPGSQLTPWTPRLFAWQAWHLATATFTLRGRRGTWWHRPSLCVAGVALTALGRLWWRTGFALCHPPSFATPSFTHHFTPSFRHHLWHTLFHTHYLCHTPSFTNTPPFTHRLSRPTLSHTIFHTALCHPPSLTHHLSHHFVTHTIFHTPLCHTPSFTHNLWHTIFHTPPLTHHLSHTVTDPSFTHHFVNFVTHHPSPHHLSHTTLSPIIFRHTIFLAPLCHTPSFTYTTLSHTIFHTQLSHTTLSHTPSFPYNFVTHTTLFYFSILHHLLCLSFLPHPRYNTWCSLLEEVALWGYPVL